MPDKIKVKLFIHLEKYEFEDGHKHIVTACDMTESGYVLLGTEEVEVSVPNKDPFEAELEMLGKKLAVVEQESHNKITAIKQQIQSLQAIEHKG